MAEKESVTDRAAIKDVIEVGSSMGKYSKIPSINSDGRAGGSPFGIVDSGVNEEGCAGKRRANRSERNFLALMLCMSVVER
jgi:hypothetical protein